MCLLLYQAHLTTQNSSEMRVSLGAFQQSSNQFEDCSRLSDKQLEGKSDAVAAGKIALNFDPLSCFMLVSSSAAGVYHSNGLKSAFNLHIS